MSRIDSTPWARAWLRNEFIESVRIRIPVGWSLHLSGRGPFRVTLLHLGLVVFDEWHADIEGTIEAALSLLPSDLEAQLRASLDERGVPA